MRIIARKTLKEFYLIHPQAKGPLDSWHNDVKHAEWKTSADLKQRYSSASFLSDNRIVFNISGNKYRLLCRVRYEPGIVFILFVGTHSEYDNIDASIYRYRS